MVMYTYIHIYITICTWQSTFQTAEVMFHPFLSQQYASALLDFMLLAWALERAPAQFIEPLLQLAHTNLTWLIGKSLV